MLANFQHNETPAKLGNLYCFWYSASTKKPRIVIGPDYMYTVAGMSIINAIIVLTVLAPALWTGKW